MNDIKDFLKEHPTGRWSRLWTSHSRKERANGLMEKLQDFVYRMQVCFEVPLVRYWLIS